MLLPMFQATASFIARTLEYLRDPPRNGESRDDLGSLFHCLLRIFAPRDAGVWCILVYIAGRRI
jgi:hypothetical protein